MPPSRLHAVGEGEGGGQDVPVPGRGQSDNEAMGIRAKTRSPSRSTAPDTVIGERDTRGADLPIGGQCRLAAEPSETAPQRERTAAGSDQVGELDTLGHQEGHID